MSTIDKNGGQCPPYEVWKNMQFSEQWLRTWVNPDLTTAQLADTLTMGGLEVEECDPAAPAFTHVVVGEVVVGR